MAFLHGKDTSILVDAVDFSGVFTQMGVSYDVALAQTTTFQPAGDRHTYLPGLVTSSLSLSGFYEGDDDKIDHKMRQAFGASGGQLYSAAYEGWAVGKAVDLLESHQTGYNVDSDVDDVSSLSADLAEKGFSGRGVSLSDVTTAVSATVNGASVDNGAASSDGAIAHLHVVSNSRDGAVVIKVQHSVDDAVWVDLITFAATVASTITSERKEVSGTVNRYTRMIVSSVGGATGSVMFGVAFARK
jgi:hypothetical protein